MNSLHESAKTNSISVDRMNSTKRDPETFIFSVLHKEDPSENKKKTICTLHMSSVSFTDRIFPRKVKKI